MIHNIHSRQLTFVPDVEVTLLQASLNDDFKISFPTNDDTIYLGYCLHGRWQTKYMANRLFEVAKGNMSCIAGVGAEWNNRFFKGSSISGLSICIPIKKMKELTGNHRWEAIYKPGNSKHKQVGMDILLASKNILASVSSIVSTYEHSPTEQLMLESNILALIHSTFACFSGKQQATRLTASPKDVERLHHVREILVANLENPPSLSTLSSLCGMNEYKLKQTFKSFFGTTIYNYSKGLRLEEARRLMEREGHSVTDAATAVGYYSFGHFSRSYHQRFGFLPKHSVRS